jgi:hypothetical protein
VVELVRVITLLVVVELVVTGALFLENYLEAGRVLKAH